MKKNSKRGIGKVILIFFVFVIVVLSSTNFCFIPPSDKSKANNENFVQRISSHEDGYTNLPKGIIAISRDIYYIPSKGDYVNGSYLLLFENYYCASKLLAYKTTKLVFYHEFKIMPLVLVKGNLVDIINFLKRYKLGKVYVFHNKLYYPAVEFSINENEDVYPNLINVLDIGAQYFWSSGYNGSSIKIGIIDTGIDQNHPDLRGKIIASKSFVLKKYGYKKDELSPSDGNGHGTFIASVICGTGKGNLLNGTGVAPNALILNAKVFPSGKASFGTTAGIIAALEWLSYGPDFQENTGDEADVINMSLSGPPSFMDVLEIVIDELVRKGFIVVIAAGNRGHAGVNSMSITSPGTSIYSITVGGAKINGSEVLSFSSIGPTPKLIIKPDIVAPAKAIAAKLGGGYRELFGTSVSTAYVTGAVSLILEYVMKQSLVSPKEDIPGFIKMILSLSAKKCESFDELWCGAGYVNLKNAFYLLQNMNSELMYVAPNHIPVGYIMSQPYFPYNQYVFKGEKYSMNLTIYSPIKDYLELQIEGNISTTLTLLSESRFLLNSTISVIPFIFRINEDSLEGFYYGAIKIIHNGKIIGEITINYRIQEEIGRIMIDLRHSPLIENMKFGLYREFLILAEGKFYYSEHNWRPITLSRLIKYNVVLIPNAFPAIQIYNINGSIEKVIYPNITKEEIHSLTAYIENYGLVIISVSFSIINNFALISKVTEPFYIRPRRTPIGTSEKPVIVSVNNSILLNNNVSSLLHYGSGLEVISPFINVLAEFYGIPTACLYLGRRGGLLAFASTMYLDNYGFASRYGNDTKNFAKNILEFVSTDNSQLNITIGKVTRGEKVGINVRLGETYDYGILSISDLLGTNTIANITTKESISEIWIDTRVAGNLFIGLKLIMNGKFVARQCIIRVIPKSSMNPKVISYQNETIVNLTNKEWLNLTCFIVDDEGLLPPKYFTIITRISDYYVKYTIINSTMYILFILVTTDLIKQMMQYYQVDTLNIQFTISITDVDLNNNTFLLSVYAYIRREETFLGFSRENLIDAIIVFTMIITTIILITVERKRKLTLSVAG